VEAGDTTEILSRVRPLDTGFRRLREVKLADVAAVSLPMRLELCSRMQMTCLIVGVPPADSASPLPVRWPVSEPPCCVPIPRYTVPARYLNADEEVMTATLVTMMVTSLKDIPFVSG
jgi:hypothetical protein